MINNDVLRSIRYMLDLSDARVVQVAKLANYTVEQTDVVAYLKKEDEEGFAECSDEVLAHFLDGLVFFKRGKDESRPALPVATRITNNLVLKKLRVAFELKEDDMHAVMHAAGFPLSKPELSAFFRKPEQKNYRVCGDQVLRNFLKGLTRRLRPDSK